MILQPATQFCCGCSLDFGTTFILLVHLARSLALIALAAADLCFGYQTPMSGLNPEVTLFLGVVGLSGLPVIMFALWSVAAKNESGIRMVLLYLLIFLFVDMGFTVYEFILQSPCDGIDQTQMKTGDAFACGAASIMSWVAVVVMIFIEVYALHVMLSFAQELAMRTGGDFSELAKGSHVLADNLKRLDLAYHSFGDMLQGPMYGSSEAQEAAGMHGSRRILFGLNNWWGMHEMRYPPPQNVKAS